MASSTSQCRSHTSVLTHQILAKNKIAVIPHPQYSPDLAPCNFFLFTKMKLKLKGRRFNTIEEIQDESLRVLVTLTEKTSTKRSRNGGDGGNGVYMQEGNTSRVTAVDRPHGEFYDFYSISPEILDQPSYKHLDI